MPLLTLQELELSAPLLRNRAGRALGRCAMRLLSVDRANALYDRLCHLRGADFARGVLGALGIEYHLQASTPEVIAQLGELSQSGMPFITISNHPYGSVDGLILADCFGHMCPRYKLVANKVLLRIEALAPSLISVVPTGAERGVPTRESILGIRHALAHLRAGGSLGLFPAGAVSNLSLRHRCVLDREWQLPIVRFMAKARVPILPVHFGGGNSLFYYLLGLIDWRVRLLRLPAEVFNKSHRPVLLHVGPLVSVAEQQEYLASHTAEEFGLWLRGKVYGVPVRGRAGGGTP